MAGDETIKSKKGPGIVAILIAILIVALPEILGAFLASIIIVAGIGALYMRRMIRKSGN